MIINKCKLVGSAFLAFGLLGNMAHGSSDADTVAQIDVQEINVQDKKGNTMLHDLVQHDLWNDDITAAVIDEVMMRLEWGDDPCSQNEEGQTARDLLIMHIKEKEAQPNGRMDPRIEQAKKLVRILERAEGKWRAREEAKALAEREREEARERAERERRDRELAEREREEAVERAKRTMAEAAERAKRAREEALERAEREREEAEALAEREREEAEALAEREREEAVERAERAREEAAELAQRHGGQHAGWRERLMKWLGLERVAEWFRFGGEKAGERGRRSPSR
jgi:hypothetical protein